MVFPHHSNRILYAKFSGLIFAITCQAATRLFALMMGETFAKPMRKNFACHVSAPTNPHHLYMTKIHQP